MVYNQIIPVAGGIWKICIWFIDAGINNNGSLIAWEKLKVCFELVNIVCDLIVWWDKWKKLKLENCIMFIKFVGSKLFIYNFDVCGYPKLIWIQKNYLMFLLVLDYYNLCIWTKYSEYNSNVARSSVCNITYGLIYMQHILDKYSLLLDN